MSTALVDLSITASVVDGDEINGEEQGVGDEEKRGDDKVKGSCVASDTPNYSHFGVGRSKRSVAPFRFSPICRFYH